MSTKITGAVRTWELFDQKRLYSEINLPFKLVQEIIRSNQYSAISGKGEQRDIIPAHIRKLSRELRNGTFTPTSIGVGLSKKQRDQVKIKDGQFELDVDAKDPLHKIDGGHRTGALEALLEELKKELDNVLDEKLKEKTQRHIDQIEALPIPIILNIDGDLQQDFINLQAGRSVDPAHMLSLKIQRKVLDEPEFKLAFQTAKILSRVDGSPFREHIRFDSRGKLPLPISTILQKGSSDVGTSLVGLARVALSGGRGDEWAADIVLKCFETIKDKAPALLEYGKVLTPIGSEGTRGSATMLIGPSVCLAYRVIFQGETDPSEKDLKALVASAKFCLDETVDGNFSGADKRRLLGAFARDFFQDLKKAEMHDGLPRELLEILSPSTFAAEALPKKIKAVKEEPKPEAEPEPQKNKPSPAKKGRGRPKKEPEPEIETAEHVTEEVPPEPDFDEKPTQEELPWE